MKHLLILFVVVLTIGATSCRRNSPPANDCEGLKTALISHDLVAVKANIGALCTDLQPRVSATDEEGHYENLVELTRRISNRCGTDATLLCYVCIKTLPPQSEIAISFTRNGQGYRKVIDISTSRSGLPAVSGMHE